VRVALVLLCIAAAPVAAQTSAPDGIPVRHELVRTHCGGCHGVDDQQRMSRISYRRTTPENWERTIKRMIQLNHVAIEPAAARTIVKYLSDNHGLAPEEARSISFEVEHRLVDFTYAADKETAAVCSSCHSIGRVMSERRTKEEWDLLIAMHRGYYPLVDNQPMNDGQGFRRTRALPTEPAADGRPPDSRQPMERVVEHLARTFPLTGSAWADWAAARQSPALAGRWALSGYVAGKGRIFGVVTITADEQAADTFVTEARYAFASSGDTAVRKGRSVVYAGFQWRGRSADTTPGAATWREVMFVERAQKEMWGRWFAGGYDELGIDVKLVRIGAEPIALGPSTAAMKTSTSVPALRIYGANFPARLRPDQVSLGQGITVTRIVAATSDMVTLAVDIASDARPGPRDTMIAGAHQPAALTVYDKVDSVRVLPQAGLARVGGAVFPKQLQQFEAVAFHNGPDRTPNTADDWNLGAVDAQWALEEYAATFDDDDLKFVGTIDAAGLFTPNVDGPNTERSGGRNNIGDVWVIANVSADPSQGIVAPIRARGHLVVAPPVYINWLASGTGQ
jgi:quinohemoprotein amine dehydrogenase